MSRQVQFRPSARRRARLAVALAVACLAAAQWGAPPSSAAGSCAVPSFRPLPVYPMNGEARDLAAADFNADGKLDLVGANYGAGQLVVFLNDGTGTQAAGKSYAAGTNPTAVVAADFNGDGKPDLAAADYTAARVAVLLNDGTGNFGTASFVGSGGANPNRLAAGDFNRDGKTDLSVTNEASDNVAILTGDGAGGFALTKTYDTGDAPRHVLVADFNNDAKQDLAVAPFGATQIFLGDGAGSFTPRAGFTCAASGGTTLAAGDLNGDGNVDLLVGVGIVLDEFRVSLGDGTGCFRRGEPHRTTALSLSLADFNGDGKLDALTHRSLSLGRGDGTFATPVGVGGRGSYAAVPGDFDGDTRLDVATVGDGPPNGALQEHSLSIVFGDGAGRFRFGFSGSDLVAGDFNEDGKIDLATNNGGAAQTLGLLLGDGVGGVIARVPVPVPATGLVPVAVRAADLNADAHLDLIAVLERVGASEPTPPGAVAVVLGDGAGGFSAPALFDLNLESPRSPVLADLNSDGRIDLVVAGASAKANVLLGAGNGTFGPALNVEASQSFGDIAVADFDSDGKPDLAQTTPYTQDGSGVAVQRGNGAGGFGPPVIHPSGGTIPIGVAAGDFNGDGKADLLVTNSESNNVSLLPGNGAGGFGQPVIFATGARPDKIILGDFNGDGKTDVVTANSTSRSATGPAAGFNDVSVLPGDGAGSFGPAAHFTVMRPPNGIAAADLNGDGRLDLATIFGNLSVLLNSCYGAASSASVQFDAPRFTVNEGSPSAVVTVRRTGDVSGEATVEYTTLDDPAAVRCDDTATRPGTAFARCDYATAVGALRFAPGETTKTFPVSIIDDAHQEPDEIVRLALRDPAGVALGAQSTAALVIRNGGAPAGNPIDGHAFFLRQHYLDFLTREPEQQGFLNWLEVLNNCPDAFNHDPAGESARCDRNFVSSAFFRSQEFNLKGFYVFRFYRVSFARLPRYGEIVQDMNSVTGQTPAETFQRRARFAEQWIARTDFAAVFGQLSNAAFVDRLLSGYGPLNGLPSIRTPNPQTPDDQNAKITITRQQLIDRLNAGAYTRAQVVRAVADSDEVDAAEFRRAFVAMQYFGYLRRDPDQGGFDNWLNYLNANPDDFYTMVNGFLYSQEYRLRFGPVN